MTTVFSKDKTLEACAYALWKRTPSAAQVSGLDDLDIDLID